MSGAPVFGDRVKLKVALDPGHRNNEEHTPGQLGVVVQDAAAVDGVVMVRVLFQGDDQPIRVPAANVTTDLDWATPRETAAINAVGAVLRAERCASQEPKVSRIARKVIAAADAARERFDVQAAMPKDAPAPTAAEKITAAASGSSVRDNRPHSRACGVSPHPHGVHCSTNCPTCHGKDDPA